MKYDVVIPYRENSTQELAYCVRSIVKNFRHNDIHIIGEGKTGVDHKRHKWVNRPSAYLNVESKIIQACEELVTTEYFWLFNDDFFVMDRVNYIPVFHRETLRDHLQKRKYRDSYSIALHNTIKFLNEQGIDDPISYELHVPMLFNTKKRLEHFNTARPYWRRQDLLMRSVYGNLENLGGDYVTDVKNPHNYKEAVFISTSDVTFQNDEIGKYIREKLQ